MLHECLINFNQTQRVQSADNNILLQHIELQPMDLDTKLVALKLRERSGFKMSKCDQCEYSWLHLTHIEEKPIVNNGA